MARRILDAAEFQEAGYLAEVNRVVLHPLGVAMAVSNDEPGLLRRLWRARHRQPAITLGPIFDERDDPEGVCYAGEGQGPPEYLEALRSRLANVARLRAERAPARQAALGYVIQPPP